MSELKNCPFCGSKAEVWIQHGHYNDYCYVKCICCGARSKAASTHQKYKDFKTDDWISDYAVEQCEHYWNMRAGGKGGA